MRRSLRLGSTTKLSASLLLLVVLLPVFVAPTSKPARATPAPLRRASGLVGTLSEGTPMHEGGHERWMLPRGGRRASYRVALPSGWALAPAGLPRVIEARDGQGRARARLVVEQARDEQGVARRVEATIEGASVLIDVEGEPTSVCSVWLTWRDASTMLLARDGHATAQLPDGKLLFVGGDALGLGLAEIYDPFSATFTSAGAMLAHRVLPTATTLPDGRVLIVGGASAKGEPVASAELFDPAQRAFVATGAPAEPRAGHVAASLPDGSVLVAGGVSEQGGLASAERYDQSKGEFEPLAPMGVPQRRGVAVPMAGGKVLVACGDESGAAALFDPKTGSFSPTLSPSAPCFDSAAVLLADGDVLIAGGAGSADPVAGEGPAADQIFHTKNRQFSTLASSLPARRRPAALLLPDGEVLVAGGTSESSAMRRYVPGVGFAPAGSLDEPRGKLSLSLLPTGSVLVAGGSQNTTARLSGVQALRVASTFPPEIRPSSAFTSAVPLPDGSTLVAQGSSVVVVDPSGRGAEQVASDGYPQRALPLLLPSGLVLFGPADGSTGDAAIFDFHTRTFSRISLPVAARPNAGLAVLDGGWVMLSGGGDYPGTTVVERVNLATGERTELSPLPTPSFGHTITRIDERHYLLTGAPLKLDLIYDAQTDSYQQLPVGTFARRPDVIRLADGDLLVLPTATPLIFSNIPSTAIRLDAATLEAKVLSGLPVAFASASAPLPDGKVLYCGGQKGEWFDTASDSAHIFDPATNSTTPTGNMLAPRWGHKAVPMPDGRVLIVGGDRRDAEIYDPDTGTFSLAPGGPQAPGGATLSLLSSGEVLLASDRIVTLDASLTSITERGPLVAPRTGHSATTLLDGRVLLAGGRGADGTLLSSVELIDPATFVSSGGAALEAPRAEHVAVRLASGKVLLAGGTAPTVALRDEVAGSTTEIGALEGAVTGHAAVRRRAGDVLIGGGKVGEQPAGQLSRVSGDGVAQVASLVLPGRASALSLADGSALLVGDGVIERVDEGLGMTALKGAPLGTVAAVQGPVGDVMLFSADEVMLLDDSLAVASRAPLPAMEAGSLRAIGLPSGDALVVARSSADGHDHWAVVTRQPAGVTRPRLSTVPQTLQPGEPVTVSGEGLKSPTAVGAGALGGVADRRPVVLFVPDVGGGPVAATVTSVGEGEVTFVLPRTSLHGPGRLHAVVDAVPSLGAPVFVLAAPLGAICDRDVECESGHCVEGVCCDSSCASVCTTCRAASQGPGAVDGLCREVAAGLDPRGDCEPDDTECGRTGACEAAACQLAPKGKACGDGALGTCAAGTCIAPLPARCDGDGVTLLSSDGSRVSCSPYLCSAGACLSSCDGASGCAPSFSCTAEGACRSCDGAGEAVLIDGTSVPCAPYRCVAGACLAACENDQGCSGGYRCDGGVCGPYCDEGRTAAVVAGEVTACAPFRCSEGRCLSTCDGDDDCSLGLSCVDGDCRSCTPDGRSVDLRGALLRCEPFVCRAGACVDSCTNDADCQQGYRCDEGVCAGFCDQGDRVAVEGAMTQACAPYRCVKGRCPSSCETSASCEEGLRCGADGRCKPPPPDDTAPPGCSTARGQSQPFAAALLLSAFAALWRRRRAALAAVAALSLAPLRADAQAQPDPAALAAAKEDFRKGVVLFEGGDVEIALEYFRRSRASFASKQNTLNMALCLDRLGRFDEALELYQEAVATFSRDLSDADRKGIPDIIAALRSKVGEIEVSSNVDGSVVIDGRPRGKLPSATAFRALPGQRVLRVLRDGYATYEARIDVKAGGRVRVDARLEALTGKGRLRVEAPELPDGDVLVDGVVVGKAPWEGTLAPGPHVVSGAGGPLGSAPTLGVVLEGQTTLLRLRTAPLGASVQLTAAPRSASLRLGGVPLGSGEWQGRLPAGDYEVEATEDGYKPAKVAISVGASGRTDTQISLEVDPAHPRWPRAPSGRLWLGVAVAPALSRGLGSGAEQRCGLACDAQALATGVEARAQAGYLLPIGASLEASFGYLSLSKRQVRGEARTIAAAQPIAVRYDLDERPSLAGFFASLGLGIEAPLAHSLTLSSAIEGGVLFATLENPVTGVVRGPIDESPAFIPGQGQRLSSTIPFVWPSIMLERSLGPLRLGVALGALFAPGSGPTYDRGSVFPTASCSSSPRAAGCVPERVVVADERSHGPLAIVLPELRLRWLEKGSP